jgi:hypothetical protein
MSKASRKRKGNDAGIVREDGPKLVSLSDVPSMIPESLQVHLAGVGMGFIRGSDSIFRYHDCGSNQVTKEMVCEQDCGQIFVHQASHTLAHVRFAKRHRYYVLEIWNMLTDTKVIAPNSVYKESTLFFSNDGSRILNCYKKTSWQHRFAMLDAATGAQLWNVDAPNHIWNPHQSISFSANGEQFLVRTGSSGVDAYNSNSGESVPMLVGMPALMTLTVNQFGHSQLCATVDSRIYVWNFVSNEQAVVLDMDSGTVRNAKSLKFVHEDRIAVTYLQPGVAINEDRFAFTRPQPKVDVWDINSCSLLFSFLMEKTAALIPNPANETLLFRLREWTRQGHKEFVHVLNSATGEQYGSFETDVMIDMYCDPPLNILM